MTSSLRRDGDFYHAVATLTEEPICLGDVVELEAMRDERTKVEATAANHVEQAAHPLLAAGAKRRDDAIVGQSGPERLVRDGELAGVDAEAGERAARTKHAERALERLLRPARLDRQ